MTLAKDLATKMAKDTNELMKRTLQIYEAADLSPPEFCMAMAQAFASNLAYWSREFAQDDNVKALAMQSLQTYFNVIYDSAIRCIEQEDTEPCKSKS